MPSRRPVVDELKAALARRLDPDVAAVLEQAETQARAEVVARLKELFVEDLLERTLQALREAGSDESSLSLVGVVPTTVRVDAEQVDVVRVGDLAALVSELGSDELDDSHVLERRVRAHNDALLAALEAGPVVPIRFGTLFINTAEVAGWLERNEQALLAELDRLRDAVEWALTLSVCPQTAAEQEPAGVGSAETYLERRLAEGESEAHRRQLLAERTTVWHERLAAKAVDAVIGGGDSLLDAAYLVHRSNQPEFDALLAVVQAEFESNELRSRLTGPWPPFSFVDANLL